MISYSQYSEWYKNYNTKFYSVLGEYFNKFEDTDKRFNRIYFDLPIDSDNFKIKPSTELVNWLTWKGYIILDYNKGICTTKTDSREIRIGKILYNNGRLDLLEKYSKSKENTLKNIEDLQVVICRHPYDLLGLSTGRGWSSCIDLNDKIYNCNYHNTFKHLLSNGLLAVYLIRKSDRNIKRPISRIRIDYTYGNLVVSPEIFGVYTKEFMDFVDKWVYDYNKNRQFTK